MSAQAIVPRYMSRFRCISERCEEICCSGLRIPVPETEWRRLQKVIQDSGAPPPPDEPQNGPNGVEFLMPKDKSKTCTYLDTEKLCSIQRRFGEQYLPSICITYPRHIAKWEGQLSMVGSLGCPEVARLALLEADAMDEVPIEAERVPLPKPAEDGTSQDPEEGWGFHANAVRATALRLLRRKELPLTERLYLLAQLACRLDPFYFEGTKAFRGEGRAASEARLTEELRAIESLAPLESTRRALAPQELPGAFFAEVYTSLLKTRADTYSNDRFRQLAHMVMDSYGGPTAAPEEAWRRYSERRQRLERTHGARLDQYFSHQALNHWLRGPFAFGRRVLVDIAWLVINGGLQRWALMGHPEVVRQCEENVPETPESRQRLDQAAVECFQPIYRHMDNSKDIIHLSQGIAGACDAEGLKRVLLLLKGYLDPVAQAA
jgi:lysine-N-methylase